MALPRWAACLGRPLTENVGLCIAAYVSQPRGNSRCGVKYSMVFRVVRLGSARLAGEGTRIGTVRRPPRGVAKSEFASGNWYDVWFPNLAPSVETLKLGPAAKTPAQWSAFARKYRAEMATPDNSHAIELLAVLSRQANFSVGCYCEVEARCHRSVLRALLVEKGAEAV
jgi:uncharacterized protein YeaO (DUF488 family)